MRKLMCLLLRAISALREPTKIVIERGVFKISSKRKIEIGCNSWVTIRTPESYARSRSLRVKRVEFAHSLARRSPERGAEGL